jgi:hypothetical protein
VNVKLWDEVKIIEPHPAVYLHELDAIVVADLHLGYEGIMAERGVFIPKVQFEQEMWILESILEKQKAEKVIVCGDVKHEFSETSYHEFIEVTRLFEFLCKHFREVIVLRGNHDNYLIRVTERHGAKLRDELELGRFYFFHGHGMPSALDGSKASFIVMAHEHPAIALFDDVGTKEKMNCFLYGNVQGRNLLVLPALSTLAAGSEINVIPREDLLSPFLKQRAEIDELKAVGVNPEVGCLEFPKLKKLRF